MTSTVSGIQQKLHKWKFLCIMILVYGRDKHLYCNEGYSGGTHILTFGFHLLPKFEIWSFFCHITTICIIQSKNYFLLISKTVYSIKYFIHLHHFSYNFIALKKSYYYTTQYLSQLELLLWSSKFWLFH